MNLLPTLTQNVAPLSRKLFCATRRMRSEQSAMVITSSSNPRQHVPVQCCGRPARARQLKDAKRDVYHRLVREWNDWNASMLPEIKESFTHSFNVRNLPTISARRNPTRCRTFGSVRRLG